MVCVGSTVDSARIAGSFNAQDIYVDGNRIEIDAVLVWP